MRRLLLLSLLFFSVACEQEKNANNRMAGDIEANYERLMEVPATHQSAPPSPEEAAGTAEITKKVVKTGGIDFQSENIEEDYKAIQQLLPRYNAYIENENQSKTNHRISYNLTIRVPSQVYDTLYSSLTTLATKLDNRYSDIEDVTERYYDLKTRIKNKKVLEQRYLDLLSKATEIKDILEIERNLNQIRIEIEGLEGQFNYLSKQVNFSTIKLNFYEVLPYTYAAIQREGFGARLLSALNSGWQGFLSFLIGLTTLWPFLFLLVAAVLAFGRLRRRWKKV